MVNSLSQIIAEPPSCSQIFQIVYFRLLSPTTEYKEVRRQGCAITFSSGQYFSFFHPPDSQSLAVRMAPSFVACRVLFARGIIIGLYSVLTTMAMAEGMGEICGCQPLWLTPLCPFTCASVCMDQTVFCSIKTANLHKVIIGANSTLMSSTSSQRMVKLSSLPSCLVHALFLCIGF